MMSRRTCNWLTVWLCCVGVISCAAQPDSVTTLEPLKIHDTVIEGIRLARELSQELIALSLAFLGFSITFLKDLFKGKPQSWAKRMLVLAWLGHLASILGGLFALMGLTGALLPVGGQQNALVDVTFSARLGSGIQLMSFGIGTLALCAFGWLSLETGNGKDVLSFEDD